LGDVRALTAQHGTTLAACGTRIRGRQDALFVGQAKRRPVGRSRTSGFGSGMGAAVLPITTSTNRPALLSHDHLICLTLCWQRGLRMHIRGDVLSRQACLRHGRCNSIPVIAIIAGQRHIVVVAYV